MSVDCRPLERRPTPPGRFIQHDILDEYGLTQDQLAQRLRVSRLTVNELVKGKRALTASMALRLSRLTGQSVEYWLNLQQAVEIWVAREDSDNRIVNEIEPLDAA